MYDTLGMHDKGLEYIKEQKMEVEKQTGTEFNFEEY